MSYLIIIGSSVGHFVREYSRKSEGKMKGYRMGMGVVGSVGGVVALGVMGSEEEEGRAIRKRRGV